MACHAGCWGDCRANQVLLPRVLHESGSVDEHTSAAIEGSAIGTCQSGQACQVTAAPMAEGQRPPPGDFQVTQIDQPSPGAAQGGRSLDGKPAQE